MAKKDTKTKILDAALELFSEKGYKPTTTRKIADKASVNEVTIFRNFESKEGVFMAVIEREAMNRMELIKHEIEPSENMEQELYMIASFMREGMLKQSEFFKLLIIEVRRYPEIWDHIGSIPLAGVAMLAGYLDRAKEKGLVRKDIDSEVMAVTFFSYLFRVLVANAFLGHDLFYQDKAKNERDDEMKQFVKLFVSGIEARSD